MRTFDYAAPTSLEEALSALGAIDGARALAGGTDLVIQMKEAATRFPYPTSIISLLRVPELKGFDFSKAGGLRLGPGVTMAEIAGAPMVRERFTALAEGAGIVGSIQTMNMATVGGNLCNAAPSADTAPPLLAFGAVAEIASTTGRRSVALTDFFRGPGQTAVETGELLVELRVPVPAPNTGSAYNRHTPRKQMDIAVVGVAAIVTLEDDRVESARIALGAVAPTPIRATEAEEFLKGRPATDESFAKAAEVAANECTPISDVRGSAEFRRHLVRVMTERMLRLAVERAGGQ